MNEATTVSDYEAITSTCDYIDGLGHYARYDVGNEESVWVCEYCEDTHVDPYEQDCACYQTDEFDLSA